jgi:hypothetical protein
LLDTIGFYSTSLGLGLIAIIKPLFLTALWTFWDYFGLSLGGDEGDRTPGLGVANAALSQLSYIPNISNSHRENVGEHILLLVLVSRNC